MPREAVKKLLQAGNLQARARRRSARWWGMPTAQAVVFHEFGLPADVARCERLEVGEPGTGEVRVRMLAAPVHPADLNRMEGRYGEKPELPAVGGIEGCGEIEAVGSEVTGLEPGQRVALGFTLGTWSERVVVRADRIAVVPEEMDMGLAALLMVNPATAWRMLHDFVSLREGDWVLFNAANSSVGRCLVEIARAKGWRGLAVVRRAELFAEMEQAGATAVLLDDNGLVEQVNEATRGAPVRLALNGVGGASALRLANALAPGGTVVTYGAMGRQPVQIPNGLLIFKDLRFCGFWVTRWFREAGPAERRDMIQGIRDLAVAGALTAQVAASFPLMDARQALTEAARDRRDGKILFRM